MNEERNAIVAFVECETHRREIETITQYPTVISTISIYNRNWQNMPQAQGLSQTPSGDSRRKQAHIQSRDEFLEFSLCKDLSR